MGKITLNARRLKPLLGLSTLALTIALSTPAAAQPKRFHIPSEDAVTAIPEFARQAGVQIIAPADALRGVRTPAVQGDLEPREALARLLQGTGLVVAGDDGRVITLHATPKEQTTPPAQPSHAASSDAIAEILVVGNRSLDVDIRRTRNDIQPYVVFDSEQIARSGAQNVEDFLQAHLPMNAQQQTVSAIGPQTQAQGRIDLRGLGPDQTLVLVDGRRLPNISTGDNFAQPSISGISMSQIERIEILPATASGIYGGGATGGVINIILKRNYSGIDLDANFGNAFDTNVRQFRLGVNGGFTLEKGRTHVLFAASHSEANSLLSTARDFFKRGAELQLRNDPTQTSILNGGANFCATDDFGGSCSTQPLALKGGAPLKAAYGSVPDTYAGAAGDGGAALAANVGRLQFKRAATPIWTAPDVTAYSANVRREFTDHIEAFVDFARDQSRASVVMPTQLLEFVGADSAANPFQQDVVGFLNIPDGNRQTQRVTNTRLNVGTIVRLPLKWSATLEYSWLRNTTRSITSSVQGAASPDADAVLQGAVFSDIAATPLANPNSLFSFFQQNGQTGDTLKTISLRMGGPIVTLPGGNLTATALIEHRDEASDRTVNSTSNGGVDGYFWTPAASRTVQSEYLELRAPIFSPTNAKPWLNALELMASVRNDAYETSYSGSSIAIDGPDGPFPAQTTAKNKASSTNYTLGFRYAPSPDLAFRASYGTGFMPPNLSKIRSELPSMFPSFLLQLLDVRDPARGNQVVPGPLVVLSGGNPSLKPEQSNSASLGVVFTPRIVSGLRISVDFTRIRKNNEVTDLPLAFFIANEASFPGRVIRGANLPGDPAGSPGPVIRVDTSSLNLSRTELKAIDIQADYRFSTKHLGTWRFYAVATNTISLSRQVLASQGTIDRAGLSDGPLKWRGNAGIDWNAGSWSAGWNAQYYDGYGVCSSLLTAFNCAQQQLWQGSSRVPSQIYNDLYLRYKTSASHGALANAEISVGINNIFNAQGPTIASGLAFANGATSYVDPRLRRFSVGIRKHF